MQTALKRHQMQFIKRAKELIKELECDDTTVFDDALIETTGRSIADYGSEKDSDYRRLEVFIETERPEITLAVIYALLYSQETDRYKCKDTLEKLIDYANEHHIMYRKIEGELCFMEHKDILYIAESLTGIYYRYYDIIIKEEELHFTDAMIYRKVIAEHLNGNFSRNISISVDTRKRLLRKTAIVQKSLREVLETLNYISEEYFIRLVEYLYSIEDSIEVRNNSAIKNTLEAVLCSYRYCINDDNKIVKGDAIASRQSTKNISLDDVLITTESDISYTHPHFGKRIYALERKAGGRNEASKTSQILSTLLLDKRYEALDITEKDFGNASDAVSKQIGVPSEVIREHLRKRAKDKNITIYK